MIFIYVGISFSTTRALDDTATANTNFVKEGVVTARLIQIHALRNNRKSQVPIVLNALFSDLDQL